MRLKLIAIAKYIYQIMVNNKKVLENYFFMTILQVINSMFYLFLYPYLIRTIGTEGYGLYVFALSISTYFTTFVNFGFDFPSVKTISKNQDNISAKEIVLSNVLTAKVYLELMSVAVFVFLIFLIPGLYKNWEIYAICFGNTLMGVLLPIWYYQGMQKMRTLTVIQLSFKLTSILFIFIFVRKPDDIWVFALIATLNNVLSGITAHLYIRYVDKIKIRLTNFKVVKGYFKDALPFFWANSTGIIKQQSTTVLIGSFFDMTDVALYDLAYKIISIPQMLVSSINGALFPKIINSLTSDKIKKILQVEALIGFAAIAGVVLFGSFLVHLLGGNEMQYSYPISVVLSLTIFTWLIVGCLISFIFVPKGLYYYVTKNQFVAFISFFAFSFIGLMFYSNPIVIAVAFSLSGIMEVIYCRYVILKNKLL
jgi:PST family polysaccharide transporter